MSEVEQLLYDIKVRLISDAQKIAELDFKENFMLAGKLKDVAAYIFDLEKRLG